MRSRQPEAPRCAHGRRMPVEAIGGEAVAQLCLKCDTQLAADFVPSLTELFFDPNLIRKRK